MFTRAQITFPIALSLRFHLRLVAVSTIRPWPAYRTEPSIFSSEVKDNAPEYAEKDFLDIVALRSGSLCNLFDEIGIRARENSVGNGTIETEPSLAEKIRRRTGSR